MAVNINQEDKDVSFDYCEQDANDLEVLNGFHASIDPEQNLVSNITSESSYFTDETLCETMKNNKGLSIVQFNARSLHANFGNIDSYISQLNFAFDVITISETWFSECTNVNVFNIKGYNLHYVSRNEGKGGGVAIYVKSSIKYKLVESKCVCIRDCFECVSIEILLNGSKNVIIACVYR